MKFYAITLACLLLIKDVLSTDEVTGPVLGIAKEYIDVSLNTTHSLNCSGHFPLAWQYQNPVNKKNFSLNSSEQSTLNVSEGVMFQSTIELRFLDHRQTGRYSCIYNSTSHGGSASLYVFVNDLLNLLLPVEKTNLTVWQERPFTVPCLATKSDADVKLWNFSEDEIVPPEYVSYDPTEGFLVADPTNYFDEFFDCKAEFDGYEAGIIEFDFIFLVKTEFPPQVRINESGIVYVVENSSFTLFCIIEALGGVFIEESWKYPVVDDSRVREGKHTRVPSVDLINRVRYIASLTVSNVTKADEGYYECNVSDHSPKFNSSKVFVRVRVQEKPYFLNTIMNTTRLEVKPYGKFELYCYVDGVPTPELTWFRDGKVLNSNNAGIKFADNFQKLIFERLISKDSGLYECRAENKVGAVTLNTTLVVLGDQISQPPSSADWKSIAIYISLSVGVFGTLILLLLIGWRVYERKRKQIQIRAFYHTTLREGQMTSFNPELPLEDQVELLPYDDRWEFPKENLKLGKTLGQGAFGRVVKAVAVGLNDDEASTTVAVKMLKEKADVNQQRALMAELKILIHLGHHVNIVNLLGAVTANICKGELMVMVEYCCYGNLRHYLLKHRDKFISQGDVGPQKAGFAKWYLDRSSTSESFGTDGSMCRYTPSSPSPSLLRSPGSSVENPSYEMLMNSIACSPTSTGNSASDSGKTFSSADCKERNITTVDLICFSFQCAMAMDYLASKKLIHRDLAARNVLLARDNVVKICDFGLAKDCYKYSNYVKKGDGPLPLKWMAIESIGDKLFTTKSDVWSFGVLLWEFFTLGGNPYPGMEADQEFYRKLKNGYRMEKPEICPDVIYEMMKKCWMADPDERPDFLQLSNALGELLDPGIRQHCIDLNEPYTEMNHKILEPSYVNIAEQESQPSGSNCLNTHVSSGTDGYDDVPPIKYSTEEGNVKAPMEVVPMINFEGEAEISKFPHPEITSEPNQLLSCTTDYLAMAGSPLSATDDSVFIDP